jgi:hypothetical protein
MEWVGWGAVGRVGWAGGWVGGLLRGGSNMHL